MKKILFRADGNSEIGLGHLYRLFAVTDMLEDKIDFSFVTKKTSTLSVIPQHFSVSLIPDHITVKKEPDWLNSHFSSNDYMVVLDGYKFGSDYQIRMKQLGYKLVYIDDLAKEHMYADLVINHSPHTKIGDYTAEPYTRFALGMDFAILRPSFLNEAKKERDLKEIKRAFICFGGSDVYDLTFKCIEGLINLNQIEEFHILLGGAYNFTGIFDLKEKHKERVFLYKNLTEDQIIEVGRRCDLAIVPTSTICYEVCTIKMAILGGYYVENQKDIYEGLLNEKIIFDGGNYKSYSGSTYETAVKKILQTPIPEINNYLQRQKTVFDGNSGKRILEQMDKLVRL